VVTQKWKCGRIDRKDARNTRSPPQPTKVKRASLQTDPFRRTTRDPAY
jgi:hypothetical protein